MCFVVALFVLPTLFLALFLAEADCCFLGRQKPVFWARRRPSDVSTQAKTPITIIAHYSSRSLLRTCHEKGHNARQSVSSQVDNRYSMDTKPFHRNDYHPSQQYVLKDRSISIRSVDGSCRGMLPLQIYRATFEKGTIKPKYSSSRSNKGIFAQSVSLAGMENNTTALTCAINSSDESTSIISPPIPDQCLSLANNNTITTKNGTMNYDNNTLSRSSRYMLDQYESLSTTQRERLTQKINAEHYASQPLDANESLRILYVDEHICVTCKPSGILSVPGPRRNPSLLNLVYETIQPTPAQGHKLLSMDQMVVHRLDMATSGIIVYALTLEALQQLHKDFKNRRVQKIYQALVHGHLFKQSQPPRKEVERTACAAGISSCIVEGEINVALERDIDNPPFMRIAQPRHPPTSITQEGANITAGSSLNSSSSTGDSSFLRKSHRFWNQAPKDSSTAYRILSWEYHCGQPVTRLELRPLTGRTHQLRVHCASALGAPIVGDDIYGPSTTTDGNLVDDDGDERDGIATFSTFVDNNRKRRRPLLLHAQKLCFYHPVSRAPMMFEVDAPF